MRLKLVMGVFLSAGLLWSFPMYGGMETEAASVVNAVEYASIAVEPIVNIPEIAVPVVGTLEKLIEEVELEPTEIISAVYGVPNHEDDCKSWNTTYMSYTAVTNIKSKQYELLNSAECYTDEETGLRMVGDRFCIAIGTGYGISVGDKVNLVMKSGEICKCIVGDVKADEHTDDNNMYCIADGSVAEAIVDMNVFQGTQGYPEELKGTILRIEVVK